MNMMKNIKYLFLASIALFLGCDRFNPLEEEQYFKQFYIVGASSVVSAFKVPFSTSESEAYISIATGGSQKLDKDVQVSVSHDDDAIAWYNAKYMIDAPVRYRMLEADHYTIPSMSTTVKAGDVYGRLPFLVNTEGLHCDSLYALTFKIDQVSDYVKTTKDTVLILNLDLVNAYSGIYQLNVLRSVLTRNAAGEWVKGNTTSLSSTRTLKAVDGKTVRFFNEVKAEIRSGYASHADYFSAIKRFGVNFTESTSGNFTIAAWDELQIVDPGSCVYNDGVFTFHYDYMDGTTRYRIEGTLTK